MKKKKVIVPLIILVVLIIISVLFVLYNNQSDKTATANIYETIQKDGYQGTLTQLLVSLTEETVLDDNSAYNEAVKIGYKGSYSDWMVLFLNSFASQKTASKSNNQKTSFDFALENGFNGTEEEWADCFSPTKKEKSAYEKCVDNEFTGNRIEWLIALNQTDENGKSIYELNNKNLIKSSKNKWLANLLEESNDYCQKTESTYLVLEACGYNESLSKWIISIIGDAKLKDNSVLLYCYAVEKGYKNSYNEWLKSLIQSDNKENSLYDKLVSKGYKGTKQDLEEAVRTSKTVDELYKKLSEKGYTGTKEELIDLISHNEENNDEPINDTNNSILYVSNQKVSKGEKNVKIIVSVKNNPGILGMKMKLEYDENVMSLKSVSNGSAVSDVLTLTKPKTLVTGCNFGWDGVQISGNDIKDGAILELCFDIKESAKHGSYPISVRYKKGDIVDSKLKPISFKTKDGNIEIE